MLLFLFLLFPLAFFAECASRKFEGFPARLLFAFCGLFFAAVFCAFKYFFMPFYFITPDSFLLNFLHVLLGQILIPLAALTFVFLFLRRKESLKSRLESILPFYIGFYAVYLPFRICITPLPFPFFYLFAKPLLFLSLLLALTKTAPLLFVKTERALLPPKLFAMTIISFVLNLILPAGIEALWITGSPAFLIALLCVLAYASAVLALLKE